MVSRDQPVPFTTPSLSCAAPDFRLQPCDTGTVLDRTEQGQWHRRPPTPHQARSHVTVAVTAAVARWVVEEAGLKGASTTVMRCTLQHNETPSTTHGRQVWIENQGSCNCARLDLLATRTSLLCLGFSSWSCSSWSRVRIHSNFIVSWRCSLKSHITPIKPLLSIVSVDQISGDRNTRLSWLAKKLSCDCARTTS